MQGRAAPHAHGAQPAKGWREVAEDAAKKLSWCAPGCSGRRVRWGAARPLTPPPCRYHAARHARVIVQGAIARCRPRQRAPEKTHASARADLLTRPTNEDSRRLQLGRAVASELPELRKAVYHAIKQGLNLRTAKECVHAAL
jgi:hypothetical protein